jgi:hypothetical protein
MSSSNYRVRRATLDDLGMLKPIWEPMRFPIPDLERRITEFQVVEDAAGKVVGGVGFQMTERQGRIHSESFLDFSLAESVRPVLWDRIHILATNHGIGRIWTQEQAPFWKSQGLKPADAAALKKLPAVWSGSGSDWLTLPLKNEEILVSLEKELAMFMEAEKQRTARAFRHAHTLKTIATGLAVVFAIFVIVAIVYMLRKNPGMLNLGR